MFSQSKSFCVCGCQFTLFSRRTGNQDPGGHARFRPHSPYGKDLALGGLEPPHQQSGANQPRRNLA